MIVCDTGPLVAAADRDDQHNRACTDLFTGLHLARRAILVPAPSPLADCEKSVFRSWIDQGAPFAPVAPTTSSSTTSTTSSTTTSSSSTSTTTTTTLPPALARLGYTTVGGSTDSGDSNAINAIRFVMPAQNGAAQSMSVYISSPVGAAPNNLFQVAIYTNNAGAPGTRLASSVSRAIVGNSWNTVPISASLVAGATYWLAYNSNGASGAVNNFRTAP